MEINQAFIVTTCVGHIAKLYMFSALPLAVASPLSTAVSPLAKAAFVQPCPPYRKISFLSVYSAKHKKETNIPSKYYMPKSEEKQQL